MSVSADRPEPPDYQHALAAAIELAKLGLSSTDIAELLGMNELAVAALLEVPT